MTQNQGEFGLAKPELEECDRDASYPRKDGLHRPQTDEENMDRINEEKAKTNFWRGLKSWF